MSRLFSLILPILYPSVGENQQDEYLQRLRNRPTCAPSATAPERSVYTQNASAKVQGSKVHFLWVPAHAKVKGNEKVNALGTSATTEQFIVSST